MMFAAIESGTQISGDDDRTIRVPTTREREGIYITYTRVLGGVRENEKKNSIAVTQKENK